MHRQHIKAGDIVSLRHYSGINPFKSIVLGLDSDNIIVKLTKQFAVMNFLDGDPVVAGYLRDGEVYVIGCNISKINPKNDTLALLIDRVDSGSEKRQYERFPVSLYADIRGKSEKKKQLAVIKDLSYHGLLVYSKADFEISEIVEVDIYMNKELIYIKTNVIRKKQNENYYEYGLGIIYEDSSSLNGVKEYIKRLKLEQEAEIKKFQNEISI